MSERRDGGAGAAMRQVGAVAWADLLERVRRYSFLVTLAGTLYFGYLVNAGYVQLMQSTVCAVSTTPPGWGL